MTVKAIIEQVRWSLDEEKGYEDYETGYMDRIIKAKIYDALRWVSLYADASLLSTDTASTTSGSSNIYHSDTVHVDTNGCIELEGNFLRLIRVRVAGWSRAIMTPITEDSEEYMMQHDANYSEAKADKTRPQAAIIESVPPRLELFPKPSVTENVSLTYAMSFSDATWDASKTDAELTVAIPAKVQTAYIYYLAYLVMIAYGDNTKASAMLETAKMNAGVSNKK